MKLKVFADLNNTTKLHQLLSDYPQFAYAKVSEDEKQVEYYLHYFGKDVEVYMKFLEQCVEFYDVVETSNYQDFKDIL